PDRGGERDVSRATLGSYMIGVTPGPPSEGVRMPRFASGVVDIDQLRGTLDLDAWRAVVAGSFVPLEVDALDGVPFRGHLERTVVDDVSVFEIVATPHVVRRTEALIEQVEGRFYKLSLQLSGPAVLEQDGRCVTLQPRRHRHLRHPPHLPAHVPRAEPGDGHHVPARGRRPPARRGRPGHRRALPARRGARAGHQPVLRRAGTQHGPALRLARHAARALRARPAGDDAVPGAAPAPSRRRRARAQPRAGGAGVHPGAPRRPGPHPGVDRPGPLHLHPAPVHDLLRGGGDGVGVDPLPPAGAHPPRPHRPAPRRPAGLGDRRPVGAARRRRRQPALQGRVRPVAHRVPRGRGGPRPRRLTTAARSRREEDARRREARPTRARADKPSAQERKTPGAALGHGGVSPGLWRPSRRRHRPPVERETMTTQHTTLGALSYADLLAAVAAGEGGREILDPATGELVGRAPEHTVADLDAAVAAARAAQPAWAALGHERRSELLDRAADAVEANAEALAELLSREQGKPLNGPNARFEVGACAAWLRATAAFPLEPEVLVDEE